MQSEDLDTFDLSKEPDYQKKLQSYGNTRLGKGALLAKRLVGSGIRFVEVRGGGHTVPHPEIRMPRLIGRTNQDFVAAEEIWRFFATSP